MSVKPERGQHPATQHPRIHEASFKTTTMSKLLQPKLRAYIRNNSRTFFITISVQLHYLTAVY